MSDENRDELLRQEGREEVLDWFKAQGIISYSSHDDIYFQWDWRNEMLLVLPWKPKK